jgi:N-acetylglucosamine kinase-like BadF-type ATPase
MGMHVLGIDVGGTKTVCLLATEDGRILGEGHGPGGNLLASGEEELERVVRHVIDAAIDGRPIAIDAICLGVAGVDREDETRTVREVVARIGYRSRIRVVNDALIALVAGVGDAPGIVIIAGTGSIVYGRNAQNTTARAGGWGHIIGDEGSGYWIGREALAAVVRASDGRGPSTQLTEAVIQHFELDDLVGLPRIVYDRVHPRMSVAGLGSVVQRARDMGDAVATEILDRAVDELLLAARSVATKLEMRDDTIQFVLAGGAFRVIPWLAEELGRRLTTMAARGDVQVLGREPALGAVQLAIAGARGGAILPHS